ncbi:hypothetical protein Vqi01_34050 [Micromonospora qiuiae]|uniref:Uncharacterized protein n=1 Tax=Micromonospora qiuiae TaxID=502268 RepID=A0ABQ4JDJ4_9ACTN|nr:hypothetical protein Vqi01_34050 [Micromonospora qiuiae]
MGLPPPDRVRHPAVAVRVGSARPGRAPVQTGRVAVPVAAEPRGSAKLIRNGRNLVDERREWRPAARCRKCDRRKAGVRVGVDGIDMSALPSLRHAPTRSRAADLGRRAAP